MDSSNEPEDALSLAELSMPSRIQIASANSVASYVTCRSLGWGREKLKEVGVPDSPPDTSLSDSPSFNLVDSFSTFFVRKPKSDSSSTSPSISPSTSDRPSLFTFSCTSSNQSDFSCVSQTSPCRPESTDIDPCNSDYLVEGSSFVDEGTCAIGNIMPTVPEEAITTCHFLGAEDSCLTSGEMHSMFRGVGLRPRMMLPSIDEMSQISDSMERHFDGDVVPEVECNYLSG